MNRERVYRHALRVARQHGPPLPGYFVWERASAPMSERASVVWFVSIFGETWL